MKYELKAQRVKADYGDYSFGNPLTDALPEAMNGEAYLSHIASRPKLPPDGKISELGHIFITLDFMYEIYDALMRMIMSTYDTRTSKENLRRMNAFLLGAEDLHNYGTQAQSGAILGASGIGKSSAIQRSLALIPQVIEHEKYKGQIFYTKQIIWLYVQCPADSSIKSFCFNLVKAIDEAIGSNHMEQILRIRSTSSSAIISYIKILCLNYNIGIICIDEIQNLVIQAKKINRIKPLIRFLTELTNDSATSILFIGTELAESVFLQEEYLRRRTRGLRLLPFKPDGTYRNFLLQLWPYQYTERMVDLTDKMANLLYDLSGGIPAYITKLFEESQIFAIASDEPMITEHIIRATATRLAIQPPKTLSGRNWLGDFNMSSEKIADGLETIEVNILKNPEKRLYANKRGRKAEEREPQDLIVAVKSDKLIHMLKSYGMLEVTS